MGLGGGGGEGILAVAVVPMEAIPMAEPQILAGGKTVGLRADLLDCHNCRLPLKPPIFKCDAEHLVCSSCRGAHAEACGGRAAVHSALADIFAAAATVPCGYERYGCDAGGVVYHEAADHRRACQHAPCCCPDRAGAAGIGGCGFVGSRQDLLDHISGPDHSRPIIVVRYGQPWNLSLPLSRRWHILVGEEDKAVAAAAGADRHRNLFLVSLGERGATTAVSLVCVRADGTAPGAPQFACKLAVESDGCRLTLESPLVCSSSLSGGLPGEVKCLPVPKDFLSGDSVPLSIHIEKLPAPPAPPLGPGVAPACTSPVAATPPPCPAATIPPSRPSSAGSSDNVAVKTVITDQSYKKRKSANPRKL
ncbi:putative E3 ubiquitin-protein ligase SINA-like 9 [Triticum dicoccoides]|uniref:SIAH-type domain-containing protein n=1 Tax=Triticum turgidum subsp. durum TaxID=4567 RepID=A0A9R1QYL2_TRITD|nr:putative E3 ubiquitin-protein ligase SINA-like 9 [Triticum dicoccoides]VAH85865.1 unnamed protein product [Triticum turgidum subsp. durum]